MYIAIGLVIAVVLTGMAIYIMLDEDLPCPSKKEQRLYSYHDGHDLVREPKS
jgi:hypothetical protein